MKLLYKIVFVICACSISEAQQDAEFGIKGGLNFTFFNVTESNFGVSTETETGYYGGVFVNVMDDGMFSLQPELLFIGLGDFKFLNMPLYAKYEVANRLDLLAGPSLNYFFDFFVNKFKVRADIAASFEVLTRLDIHVKYTLGFSEISPNGLFIGLGYRL